MSRRRSIRRHLAQSFGLTVVLPLFLAGVGITGWHAWHMQLQARNRLESMAYAMSLRLSAYLREHSHGIQILSEILERSGRDSLGEPLGRSPWLDLFNEIYPGFTTMVIANPDGRVVAGAPWELLAETPEGEIRVGEREHFFQADSTKEVQVSGVFEGGALGSGPIVAISHSFPWPGGDGRWGVVEGSLELRELSGFIEDRSASGIEIVVVDREGRVVASSRPSGSELSAAIDWDTDVPSVLPLRFVVEAPIGLEGWRVLVRQAPGSVYAPLLPFLAGVLFVILIASLVTAFIYRRLSGWLSQWLGAAAKQVESRRMEEVRVPEVPRGAPLEIDALAGALQRMIEAITAQQKKLEEHLSDLESTVAERTREITKRRREFQEFLDRAPALIIGVDEQGALLYSNDFWDDIVGRGAKEPETAHINEFLSEESEKDWWSAAEEVIRSGESAPVRLSLSSADGEALEVSGRLIGQLTADDQVSIRGVFQDISELANVQRKLQHSQEMLALFVKNAPAGIAMFDREMRYIAVSERWLEDYRVGGQDIIGRKHYEVFPEIPARWRSIYERCLQEGVSVQRDEDSLPRADGTVDWVKWEIIPWRELDGGVGGLIMLTEVITEQKLLQDQLKVLADYDSLTGLLNRRAFLSRLQRLARRREGRGAPFGLLFIDLDQFKRINDEFGHYAGDQVLQEIGTRLKMEARAEDVAGRLSGDELVILLSEVEEAELESVRERYREVISEPIETGAHVFEVSASIGGVVSDGSETADELLDRADKAMYVSKGVPITKDA